MTYDDLLLEIDGFGKYQKRILILLVLSTIPNGFFTMVSVFILDTPGHHCTIVQDNYNETSYNSSNVEQYIPIEEGTNERSQCTQYNVSSELNGSNASIIPCQNGWDYDATYGESTATTEWDLVCEKSWMQPVIISLFMVGVLVGSMVSGIASDRYGRRPVFLWGTLTQFLAMFLLGFSHNAWMFAMLYFLSGCSSLINYVAAFVLVSELVDSSKRSLAGSLEVCGFTIGYMLLPPVAYFLYNWRWLMWFMGLGGILFIPYVCWLPESPRWLLMNGKVAEAKLLIKKIAETNNTKVPDETLAIEENEPTPEHQEKFTYLDLFKQPVIRKRSLIMFFLWFSASSAYYCISFGTSNLGGNKFVNCFVAAAVEIPSYVCCYFLMERFGRKTMLIFFLLLSSVSCGLAPLLQQKSESALVVFSMMGKFSSACTFSLLYIYCCEMFPTNMRNMSIGASSTCARIGGIVAPYLVFAGQQVSLYVPYLSMSALALISTVLSVFLPETLHVPLPATIEDAIKLQKRPRAKTLNREREKMI